MGDWVGGDMNRILALVFLILVVLPLNGCINTGPIIPDGKWYSEEPNMYIEFGAPFPSEVSGFAETKTNMGEIYLEDGSSMTIEFAYLNEEFHISLYEVDSKIYKELYAGEYKLHGDTLTLYVNDGTEIILTRQE